MIASEAEPAPLRHARAVEADFGHRVWRQLDALLDDVRRDGETWPAYVYAPLAGAYAIATGGGPAPPKRGNDVARIGALSAWRRTKGIYRYDADLRAALAETDLDRDLPTDILARLPEWCVYIDLSRAPIRSPAGDIEGAYAHLECDMNDRREELRLLLVSGDSLIPIPIHLGGTLRAGIDRAKLEIRANYALARGGRDLEAQAMGEALGAMSRAIEETVSLVLYLCSDAPDVTDAAGAERGPPVPSKGAAQAVSAWDVGWRLGAALRRARAMRSEDAGGTHAGPQPHVRRAHWHAYWMGSEAKRDRRRVLRWLAPIFVGLDLGDDLAAVIRRVT